MKSMTWSALLALACGAATADAQIKVSKAPSTKNLVKLTKVEVEVPAGPDKTAWASSWNDNAPVPLLFRWSTGYSNVGSAVWQVTAGSNDTKVIASGDAGKPPAKGKMSSFKIDFRDVVGGSKKRPLNYFVRVVTYAKPEGSGRMVASASTPKVGLKKKDKKKNKKIAKAKAKTTSITKKEQAGPVSMPVAVTIGQSGPITKFTTGGLQPGLYNKMPIEIDLQTLKIRGTGGDEDPYLFVVAFFADGTTIVPVVNAAKQRIEFPTSSVRIQAAKKTHENVPVDVDPGANLAIPSATGHFETTIEPIGRELAQQHGLSSADRKKLRQQTLVGVLVIGMEEDALPSTDVMNDTRNELVASLQTELDKIVRGIKVSLSDPTNIPDMMDAVDKIRAKLKKKLVDSAKARTLDELSKYLAIHGFPAIILVPGALNADDYIGSGVALFNYEQILEAGDAGIPIKMTLDQNADEELYYKVEGRIRLK